MKVFAWTQMVSWGILKDPILRDVVWRGLVDEATTFLTDAGATSNMDVETDLLWWIGDWDGDEDDRGGFFPEAAVRVSVGPVIGPLPEPSMLHARFSARAPS